MRRNLLLRLVSCMTAALIGLAILWFSPRNEDVIEAYYEGEAAVPWRYWATPLASWFGFMAIFSLATLSITAIVRRTLA